MMAIERNLDVRPQSIIKLHKSDRNWMVGQVRITTNNTFHSLLLVSADDDMLIETIRDPNWHNYATLIKF